MFCMSFYKLEKLPQTSPIKTLKLASELSFKSVGEICIPKPGDTHKHERNKLLTKQQGNNVLS